MKGLIAIFAPEQKKRGMRTKVKEPKETRQKNYLSSMLETTPADGSFAFPPVSQGSTKTEINRTSPYDLKFSKNSSEGTIKSKPSSKKTFVIDTNVFLFDPMALYRFEDNDVVIPDIVMDEIDRFKNEQNERGANAREFARQMLKIRKNAKPGESFRSGITIGKDMGKIRIGTRVMDSVEEDGDKIILIATRMESGDRTTILITKDIMLRVRADAEGILAEDYRYDQILTKSEGPYLGRSKVWVAKEHLARFKKKNGLSLDGIQLFGADGQPFPRELYENEFVELYSAEGDSGSCLLGRKEKDSIVPLRYAGFNPSGIIPRNIGQQFAMEALLAPPSVAPLVILKGSAGTAKTLLSLASSLEAYTKGQKKLGYSYNRILVSRPAVVLDEPLGFLPGTEQEKMEPFVRGLKDNLYVIRSSERDEDPYDSPHEYQQIRAEIDDMFETIIDIESLSFLRGRSLQNYFAFFDEMQNATTALIKTVITRAGEGTKIVLAGDIEQIDLLYLNSSYNGLTYASERMKGSPLCWQVTLNDEESCRSSLAKEAAMRMKDSKPEKR